MCTVTYLPNGRKGFILTSNRDENILRQSAIPVERYKINEEPVYFPKDPKGEGTWIARGSNFTVCLLNGAFVKHSPGGNYRKSRGLVLLDFFRFGSPEDFIRKYDFTGIEPFSMLFVKHSTINLSLCELKWDGEKPHHLNHDASLPHIWSSVTLYHEQVIREREGWFYDWLKENKGCTRDSILMFHHFGGIGDPENNLVMNRAVTRTVSICCINKISDTETEIVYEDVIAKKVYNHKIVTT